MQSPQEKLRTILSFVALTPSMLRSNCAVGDQASQPQRRTLSTEATNVILEGIILTSLKSQENRNNNSIVRSLGSVWKKGDIKKGQHKKNSSRREFSGQV